MTDADVLEKLPEGDRDSELVGSTKKTLNKTILILARGHACRSVERGKRAATPGWRWVVPLTIAGALLGHPIVSVILRGG